jgi:hypothetical protein
MADSKISGLTEGTVVDPANDWFVYVDTSDPTQNPITGTTLKLRPSNVPISTAMQTALNAKEDTITAGTTSQYYRGDKTFQALDKTAVGLGNVANATTTISTSAPSGGADGDIWFQYTP